MCRTYICTFDRNVSQMDIPPEDEELTFNRITRDVNNDLYSGSLRIRTETRKLQTYYASSELRYSRINTSRDTT